MKGILHFFLFLTSHFQVLFRNTFLIGGQCCFLLPQHFLSVLRNAHTLPRPSAGARGTTSLLAHLTVKCTSHQCTPLEQWRSRQVHTATCISDRSEAVVLQTHGVVSCITLFHSCFFSGGGYGWVKSECGEALADGSISAQLKVGLVVASITVFLQISVCVSWSNAFSLGHSEPSIFFSLRVDGILVPLIWFCLRMILWCPFSGSRACRNIHTFILFLFHSFVLSLCRPRIFLEVFFPAEHRILPYQAFMTVGRRNGARFVLFLSSVWFFSYFTVELGVVLFSNLLLCLLFDFPWPDVFHRCLANR